MRLTDIMQHANLSVWAQVAFVLFGVVFLAVVTRTVLSKRSFTDHMSAMPLDDDGPAAANFDESQTGRRAQGLE